MKRCLGCFEGIGDELEVCPFCGYIVGTPPEQAVHLLPGTVLAERYIVGKVIGYGGFGVTYIGWDAKLEQRVAIKEYLPSEFSTRIPGQSRVSIFNGAKNEHFVSGLNKFVDEAKRLSKFQKEDGIVRIFDCLAENDTAYIVMEYLEGETLAERLKRERTIPEQDAIGLLRTVMNALSEIHDAGIIHRDVSPESIILTKDGRVKLIDFSSARFNSAEMSNSLTSIVRPGFSAEEQYQNNGNLGPHTDVYALGATLYRMLTGDNPPDALERQISMEKTGKDTLIAPRKINSNISPVTESAVLNALNIHIEDRTPTVQDFISDLTSDEPVRRSQGKSKKVNIYGIPLWIKILVPSLLAVIILFGVLLATGVISFKSSYKSDVEVPEGYTIVPNVEGMDVDGAADTLHKSGLDYVSGGNVLSDFIKADLIVLQDPESGKVVVSGTKIVLTVSRGNGVVALPENGISTVPAFLWSEESVALKDFAEAGFNATVEYRDSDNVSAGQVMGALDGDGNEIHYGDKLPEGSDVILIVSTGPSSETVSNGDADETAKNSEETSAQYPTDRFGLIVNEKYTTIGDDIDDVRSVFNVSFEIYEGETDNYYNASDWSASITTDKFNDVYSIIAYGDNVSIPEGIKIGDTRDTVLNTLGKPVCVAGTEFVLEDGQEVEYTYDEYLYGDVVGGKHFGDPTDYEYFYIKGDTVLCIMWQIPNSTDPNARIIGFNLLSLEEYNSYHIEEWSCVYFQ